MPQPLPRENAKHHYLQETKKMDVLSHFVGVWSEKWCDVDVSNSTKITYDGHALNVVYTKNKFTAQFVDFDFAAQQLRFNLSGGDSGWSFIYTLKYHFEGRLSLNVNRFHDSMSFNGFFKRSEQQSEQLSVPQLDIAAPHQLSPRGPVVSPPVSPFDLDDEEDDEMPDEASLFNLQSRRQSVF
ncbi:hypothetical protein SAMD00019534_075160 [Acytostelium subglobosum LB1]|uniref:hypothetical protein n=1 Tax=Acytostelium subglobosum LB1 TaxID=1410327 RepID=UPI000644D035|nr:hypothetical protein SAMD00019534_075160 [Acytostelium subglobosum LB1]GAM24341.1 hypothetical protein SAMD00019534_075160 [Acytostelium subglobosum LB1]|eukprot:XP_012752667.1 hypothetical protein SAMD00019534_075160 [Acytostelium subglobosum LB1]